MRHALDMLAAYAVITVLAFWVLWVAYYWYGP
jgi:hypothetical protein